MPSYWVVASRTLIVYIQKEEMPFTGKHFSDHVVTPILKNKLGDSAGVYGAACLGE